MRIDYRDGFCCCNLSASLIWILVLLETAIVCMHSDDSFISKGFCQYECARIIFFFAWLFEMIELTPYIRMYFNRIRSNDHVRLFFSVELITYEFEINRQTLDELEMCLLLFRYKFNRFFFRYSDKSPANTANTLKLIRNKKSK